MCTTSKDNCTCPKGDVWCKKCRGTGKHLITKTTCQSCLGLCANLEILEIDPDCPIHGPAIGITQKESAHRILTILGDKLLKGEIGLEILDDPEISAKIKQLLGYIYPDLNIDVDLRSILENISQEIQ